MLKYFLGDSPLWFKKTILGFLIINLLLYFGLPGVMNKNEAIMALGWLFIAEFIFTLAMALKCYPLQSGGLLAIEVLAMGMTTPKNAYHEVDNNLEVILLLMFMVAAIYFMKPLLMYIFSKVFIKIRSKLLLSLFFVFLSALLSAFLDALTVTAVLISISIGFYGVYHKIHSSDSDYDMDGRLDRKELSGETLEQFRSFLRSLVMHGVVGTALGGVCTLVGEPQNLLIGERIGWDFIDFLHHMDHVTIPTLFAGMATTVILELTGWFGFGTKLPKVAREIIEQYILEEDKKRNKKGKYNLIVQAISAILLIVGLALHIAPVGLIGLALIIIQTCFMGIIKENHLGKAFEEALPFTGLIVVFFVIVAMIDDLKLFHPIINWVLTLPQEHQPGVLYIANGLLSCISDNVFVATVYINQVKDAADSGLITQAHLQDLAVAINTGTNLPSVATPNGQAAFLFLLTSSLAPLINLSYGKMVKMAIPYTIVLTAMGLIGILYF